MVAFRALFPSLTRGGVSYEWPGGRFQQFAEEYLPQYDWDVRRWVVDCAESGLGGITGKECQTLNPKP